MTSLARTPHFIGCILQSDSEELATQASRRMDATRGVAAILRDAALRVAPQDEVGDKLLGDPLRYTIPMMPSG
jgi:hypothetical protein